MQCVDCFFKQLPQWLKKYCDMSAALEHIRTPAPVNSASAMTNMLPLDIN